MPSCRVAASVWADFEAIQIQSISNCHRIPKQHALVLLAWLSCTYTPTLTGLLFIFPTLLYSAQHVTQSQNSAQGCTPGNTSTGISGRHSQIACCSVPCVVSCRDTPTLAGRFCTSLPLVHSTHHFEQLGKAVQHLQQAVRFQPRHTNTLTQDGVLPQREPSFAFHCFHLKVFNERPKRTAHG